LATGRGDAAQCRAGDNRSAGQWQAAAGQGSAGLRTATFSALRVYEEVRSVAVDGGAGAAVGIETEDVRWAQSVSAFVDLIGREIDERFAQQQPVRHIEAVANG
jgi:hypothetical protein